MRPAVCKPSCGFGQFVLVVVTIITVVTVAAGEQVVEDEISHVIAQMFSGSQIKVEVLAGKDAAGGGFIRGSGEPGKCAHRARQHLGGNGQLKVISIKERIEDGGSRMADGGV